MQNLIIEPLGGGGFFFYPHFTFVALSLKRVVLTAGNFAYLQRNIDTTYVRILVVIDCEMTLLWRDKVKPLPKIPYFPGFLRRAIDSAKQ